jgi:hypothetical protein
MPRHSPLAPTRATLDNMGQAIGAFIWTLSRDARVQAAYTAWRLRQWSTSRHSLALSLVQNRAHDLAVLQAFVRNDLHLKHTGLAPLLLAAFGYSLGAQLSGQTVGPLVFVADAPDATGRRAKNRGEHIVRDVEWFYRAKIQAQPESIHAIAKEHAQRRQTAGKWRSVVQAGIARAEQLLAAVEVDGEPVI